MIDDPAAPRELVALVEQGYRATDIDRTGPPRLWAAQPYNGRILTFQVSFTEHDEALARLDTAIIVGSVGVVAVMGGLAQVLTRRLRRQIQLERRVAADMAHELRTPLTGLVSAAALLEPSRASEIVRERVDYLRNLTENILEVSQLTTTDTLIPTRPHSLDELVRTHSGEQPIEVRTTSDASVDVSALRFARILDNLLNNARVHGAAPVIARIDGSVLSIEDNGPGFPVDLLRSGPRRFASGQPDTHSASPSRTHRLAPWAPS